MQDNHSYCKKNYEKNWKSNAILFLGSQCISLFGSSLVQYAIMWYITLNTKSGSMMTVAIICGFLPTFFLSPFAGVWADRYNRKRLIILSDSMIATVTLVMALVFLSGKDDIWLLFLMSGIRAIGTAIQTPAIGAILPQIVPVEKLTKVNGINGTLQSFIMLFSPMASGALLTFTKLEVIFFIDVFTAAAAIFILYALLRLPKSEKPVAVTKSSYMSDFKLSLIYIKSHKYLVELFVFFAFFFVLISPAAFLTPLQVARTFGDEVWRLTAIEITFSIGMMLGGLLIAYWGGYKNRIHTMTLASLLIGASTLALGLVPEFSVYLIIMTLTGVLIPIFNTPCTVLLQERVEDEFLGRVFGVLTMISSAMMPMGMLLFGPLADIIKIEWMLIATGVLLFIQGFFLLVSKALIEAGKPQ